MIEVESGCIEWQGCRDHLGYGKCGRRVDGVMYYLAHRWAWAVANGPIPAGLLVCHRCDNPSCLNVEHMFLGTDADNMADRDAKGRGHSGSITPEVRRRIYELRSLGWSQTRIADDVGFSQRSVSRTLAVVA